jgi:hypothetical protein
MGCVMPIRSPVCKMKCAVARLRGYQRPWTMESGGFGDPVVIWRVAAGAVKRPVAIGMVASTRPPGDEAAGEGE